VVDFSTPLWREIETDVNNSAPIPFLEVARGLAYEKRLR
jgi:hypothetical protein